VKDETFVKAEPEDAAMFGGLREIDSPVAAISLAILRAREVAEQFLVLRGARGIDTGHMGTSGYPYESKIMRDGLWRSFVNWRYFSVDPRWEMFEWGLPDIASADADAGTEYVEKARALRFEEWLIGEIAPADERIRLARAYRESLAPGSSRKHDRTFANKVLWAYEKERELMTRATTTFWSTDPKKIAKEQRKRGRS